MSAATMTETRPLSGPLTAATARRFVLAGDAVFTVRVPPEWQGRLGAKPHYTFRVTRKEASADYPEAFFCALLTGPDNTGDFTYLGKLDAVRGALSLTRRSGMAGDSLPVRLLGRVLAAAWKGDFAGMDAAGFRLHHEGRCCRCGRRLTVPESVEDGVGPECRRRMGL
jgi:hypothetical protein